MLRQIEWGVQKRSFAKNRVLPLTIFFFEKLISVREPLVNSWFNVPSTQLPIFILFVSTRILLEGAFFLRVSLIFYPLKPIFYQIETSHWIGITRFIFFVAELCEKEDLEKLFSNYNNIMMDLIKFHTFHMPVYPPMFTDCN